MIHVSPTLGAVAVPARPDIINLFPDAGRLVVHGQEFVALSHDLSETRMLRALGLDVPAPVLTQYKWPGPRPPFEVQRKTVAMLTTSSRAYVLNGMGTGKTRSALWAWDYLRGKRHAKKLLVAAPLSTLTFTWAKEIFDVLPHRKVAVAPWLEGASAEAPRRSGGGHLHHQPVMRISTILDDLLARDDIGHADHRRVGASIGTAAPPAPR